MNDALRCLRDGVVSGRSVPFVLVQDPLDGLGGPDLAAKLFSSLCKALRDSRSQAQAFSMVPADEGCMTYMPELQALLGPALQQPCFNLTDPGALNKILASLGGTISRSEGSGQDPTHAQSSAQAQPRVALGIDSLTMLMFDHPTHQVLEWVDDLLQHPELSCLLATIHTDLHESITVKSLERMALCVLRLLPCEGQHHGFARAQQPDIAIEVCIKQRTGRMKVVTEYYQQLPDGSLVEMKPLMDTEKPLPRPQTDALPAQDAAAQALAQQMTGGMRLTLTQQESAARQSVLLPWEQRQAGAESQDEFVRATSRASADGEADSMKAAGADYGQIFYERDSETDLDSDEDPDDDLDI